MSKRRLESAIATLFGGRIAEELIFGRDAVTTGASNDIERATELARNMVTKWGLSDRMGPLTYTEESGEVFLGRQVTQTKQVSDETAHAIDEEVRRVIETNYNRAKGILQEQPGQAARDGRRADEVRDHRRQPDPGDHGRQAADSAGWLGKQRPGWLAGQWHVRCRRSRPSVPPRAIPAEAERLHRCGSPAPTACWISTRARR